MLDDEGLQNQYLTKLRVMMREDSDAMRKYSEMLLDFARDYHSRLNEAIQNVDQYSPEAAKFLEAYASLKQDFEVWVGQISFSDILELQAMYNNREIWPQRLSSLPPIPPPRKMQEQAATPQLPPLPKGKGKGMMVPPLADPPKGKGKGGGVDPDAVTERTARNFGRRAPSLGGSTSTVAYAP